jgi:hypothetical protein
MVVARVYAVDVLGIFAFRAPGREVGGRETFEGGRGSRKRI